VAAVKAEWVLEAVEALAGALIAAAREPGRTAAGLRALDSGPGFTSSSGRK